MRPTFTRPIAKPPLPASRQRIVVVGGGFSGTVFALKALEALPQAQLTLIEQSDKAARGVAYGRCAPSHLLNVPVSRMETGLTPSFEAWLAASDADLGEALAESGGHLASAFVARAHFGTYLREQLAAALRAHAPRFAVMQAAAVAVEEKPARAVVLADGRRIRSDIVVLATGNLPPRPLDLPEAEAAMMTDPWAPSLCGPPSSQDSILLVGTGLTAVDVALELVAGGHEGPLIAVSRHGILPGAHAAGGQWFPFLTAPSLSPVRAMRALRHAVADARAHGVPWQRVIDAVRPSVAAIWHGWSDTERQQFLRHLRVRWDTVRHRMPPRIAKRIRELQERGQLRVLAGRIRAAVLGPHGVEVSIDKRGGGHEDVRVWRIVNCTGPHSDYAALEYPLLANLRRQGLLVPDALRLGVETEDCAVVGGHGCVSNWLFALGSLTRPAWWEITAVPEINVQTNRLVRKLAAPAKHRPDEDVLLAEEFVDLGAGI